MMVSAINEILVRWSYVWAQIIDIVEMIALEFL